MQVLISAIDKATKAGVYNLEEISLVMQSLDALGEIAKSHIEGQKLAKMEAERRDSERKLEANKNANGDPASVMKEKNSEEKNSEKDK